MRLNLDQLETRLQAFIENSILFIPTAQRQASLARQMVTAMQASLENGAAPEIGPSAYTLTVHPATLSVWQSSPDALQALAQVLSAAAREAGIPITTPPAIRLSADASLPVDAVRVSAAHYDSAAGDTAAFLALTPTEPVAEPALPVAFLIIDGNQTFSLQQPVVNLGRRSDNHIAINDPRVSRSHAQIRAVHGRFLLFDLNSAGGTFVNGLRIDQWPLKPGDVISLAGLLIIYGEEIPPGDSDTTTYTPGEP